MRRIHNEKEVILTIKIRKVVGSPENRKISNTTEKYRRKEIRRMGTKLRLKKFRNWFIGCSNNERFRPAISKIKIALMITIIANLRSETAPKED